MNENVEILEYIYQNAKMGAENLTSLIKILNEKLTYRNPDERVLNDNKHFVNMHCNDEVATIKIYTKDKSSEDICREIITKVQGEKFNKSSSVDNYYKM